MKLKDSTFAIIAEKKDSISHKWFNENLTNQLEKVDWIMGRVFEFEAGRYRTAWTSVPLDYEHNIYTESVFEALLKAEQENEATQTFGGMTSTGGNAQTFPKNTVFGKEGIALKPSFELKGDGNVALDKNEPLAANKKEISQDDIKRAQYYLECFTKKIMPNYESTGDYSNLKDKGKIEMLVNDVYNVMVKNKDVESKWGDYFQNLIEKMDINKMSTFKYNDAADALSYPMREIVEKFKVSEIKFPKTVLHPNGFVKPFKGVAITKSEAEKILRDKFKLPDYVDFKIVE